MLTPSGKLAAQNQSPHPRNLPATSMRVDAGGGPSGPPHRPRGCGGNAGVLIAGQEPSASSVVPQSPTVRCGESALEAASLTQPKAVHLAAELARSPERDATGRNRLRKGDVPADAPKPSPSSTAPGSCEVASDLPTAPTAGASTTGASDSPANFDGLEIPDLLDRRKISKRGT